MSLVATPQTAPSRAPVPEAPEFDTRRARRVLAVSSAAVFVVFLDATIVNIAFPAIGSSFPTATRADLSWVLNAYSIVVGALLVTAGRLADSTGRKRSFLTGLAVFALASAACGVAPSIAILVAARAAQAVGAAMLVPASLALLLPEFPKERRSIAVGLWGAMGAVAAASGPTIGALLIEGPGWRWVFYANVPICAAAYMFGRRVLAESRDPGATARIDGLGLVLVTATFGMLSLGIVEGHEWGWGSWRIVAAFAATAVLAPLTIRLSAQHPAPVLPVALFRVRSFAVATGATLLFGAAFFATLLANVLFLTGVWQWSVLRTALAVLPGPILAAVMSPISGRMADRGGFRRPIVAGCVAFVAGQVWFATQMTGTPHYVADFLPGQLLIGLGIGLAFPTLGAAGAASLPPAQFAVGSAVVGAGRQLGAVIGVAGLVAVLGTVTPLNAVHAAHRSWTVIGAVALLCGLVSLLLPGRRGSSLA
jgi:EmrB/QacA subfamily drug resistance transporter